MRLDSPCRCDSTHCGSPSLHDCLHCTKILPSLLLQLTWQEAKGTMSLNKLASFQANSANWSSFASHHIVYKNLNLFSLYFPVPSVMGNTLYTGSMDPRFVILLLRTMLEISEPLCAFMCYPLCYFMYGTVYLYCTE